MHIAFGIHVHILYTHQCLSQENPRCRRDRKRPIGAEHLGSGKIAGKLIQVPYAMENGHLKWVPSGKHTKNDGKSQFFKVKSTISMAVSNSYVTNYQRVIGWLLVQDGIFNAPQ